MTAATRFMTAATRFMTAALRFMMMQTGISKNLSQNLPRQRTQRMMLNLSTASKFLYGNNHETVVSVNIGHAPVWIKK
jgi:hypothetical protein